MYNLNKYSLICCIAIALIAFSCTPAQKEVIEDDNIRVIEFQFEPRSSSKIELKATTEELSDYDCDLNWVLFDFNSYELTNEAMLELEKMALLIDQNSNFKARIRAFTDSKGSFDYNMKLSARRAMSAKNYLLSEGVPEKNISIDGFADSKPIAINTEDDTGRKYNRRIELFVLDKLNNTVCRSHPPKIPKALKAD